ncbi:MAG: glycosyltransferase family 61 protein [Candidatus Eremiobacteraeota bacterium]|nr:glycosyltransferase family 61 protein [Candidatus Eremiobacteraeota bacterium]
MTDATVHPHSALVRANGIPLADFEGDELRRFDDFIQLDPYVFYGEGEDVWIIESSALIGSDSPYHCTGPTADLFAHGKDSFEVEEGFGALLGPRSPHFGHWLWEYLPKYLVAVARGALPRVPILMNPAMPPQLWESLRLLIPRGVDIIELPFAPTHVRRLWYAPALMHEPFFENVNERYAGPDHRCFPPERFRPALEAMAEAAALVSVPAIKNERIFLARRSTQRRLENYAEIESVAAARDFTVVHPETLSFSEQIAIAHNARLLAGPEGSQMYLAFFARPRSKLCILNHPFTHDLLNFCYLVEQNGIDVTLLTGPATRLNNEPGYPNFGLPQYADYAIDPAAFARFLDAWVAC